MDISETVEVKVHEKCIFRLLTMGLNVFWVSKNQISMKKKSKFSHFLTVRAEVANPPPSVNLTVKYLLFFDAPPKSLIQNNKAANIKSLNT